MVKGEYAVVFPVAGMSSRFAGKPKWFVRVGPEGEPLIEFSLNQAISAGFNKVYLVVGEHTEKLFRNHFGDSYRGVPVYYAKQTFDKRVRDRPWGTVDALCSVLPMIDCPFVFCNGDDIYGESSFAVLIEHLKSAPLETACMGHRLGVVIPQEGKVNRAVYTLDDFGFVRGLTETFNIEMSKLSEKNLTKESLVSMNIFALYPETVFGLSKLLEKFKAEKKDDRKAECLLPEELSKMISDHQIRMKCYPTSERWFGITNPEDEDIVREQIKEYYT